MRIAAQVIATAVNRRWVRLIGFMYIPFSGSAGQSAADLPIKSSSWRSRYVIHSPSGMSSRAAPLPASPSRHSSPADSIRPTAARRLNRPRHRYGRLALLLLDELGRGVMLLIVGVTVVVIRPIELLPL
jgi:hypothetical protein